MFSSGFIHHKGRFFVKNENIQKLNYPCLNTMVVSVLFRRPDVRVWHTGSGFSWSTYLKIVWAPEESQMMRNRIAEKIPILWTMMNQWDKTTLASTSWVSMESLLTPVAFRIITSVVKNCFGSHVSIICNSVKILLFLVSINSDCIL